MATSGEYNNKKNNTDAQGYDYDLNSYYYYHNENDISFDDDGTKSVGNKSAFEIYKNDITRKNYVQNIHIEIEEVILDGFKRIDSNLVATAIKQELSLFLSACHFPVSYVENNDGGGIQTNRNPKISLQIISMIDAGSFSLNPGKMDSKSIGRGLGQSIFKVLEEQTSMVWEK